MAIIKLKRLSMVALKDDRDRLTGIMQDLGCVQITQMPASLRDEGYDPLEMRAELSSADESLAMLTSAMASLNRHAPQKKGMFVQRPQADTRMVEDVWGKEQRLIADCRRIMDGEAQLTEIRQRIARLDAQNAQLKPLEGVKVPLDEISDTGETVAQLGTVQQAQMEDLIIGAAALEFAEVIEVGRQADMVYIIALAHKEARDGLATLLTQNNFSRLTLRVAGTVANQIASNEGEIAALESEREDIVKDIASYADRLEEMQLLYDLVAMEKERLDASAQFACTDHAIYLSGWIPENCIKKLDEALERSKIMSVCEYSDPQEGDEVPTFVQNNKFLTPYESITNMFSPPGNEDIDPTAHMMPFFVMFFGMMVSDAGYGLVIFLGAMLAVYKLKFRGMLGSISKVLIVGGLATLFWGALFGSWFGIEGIKAPLFIPMESPLQMLGLCFGLGAVHLFYGMGLRAYMAFKQGDWQTAVFDEFAWIFLILGLVSMLAGPLLGMDWLGSAGAVTSVVCVLAILLFAGRSSKGIGRIVGGLGALYGITSYLSDILSYARLFAMGLATAVICLVFNTIAGLLLASPVGFIFGIIVLLIGHVFNLAINALGAYVHSCRLQYIEFFNKFYTGGGREFSPLSVRTKFITLKK